MLSVSVAEILIRPDEPSFPDDRIDPSVRATFVVSRRMFPPAAVPSLSLKMKLPFVRFTLPSGTVI